MTQETEREAFEKAAKLEGLNVARHRIGHDDYDCDNTQWRWLGFKHGLMQARARVGKGEVERDSISAEEIKGWRLDPKVHDAILNRADPFSVAWHQREKEHQAALSAKAKPIEVGDEHTDDCAINELGDVCDCGVARNIYPMLGTTDTELTRLKRQVEVMSKASFLSCENRLSGGVVTIGYESLKDAQDAMFALAAADRIAKGCNHRWDTSVSGRAKCCDCGEWKEQPHD